PEKKLEDLQEELGVSGRNNANEPVNYSDLNGVTEPISVT
ncbi:9304_t:CDS:1, partial [Ambispora gerdemannii]